MPLRLLFCSPLILIAIATRAVAQEEQPISWAYGAYFGTGYYELATGEETFVASMRPGWRWRDAELRENGRSIGVHFRVPVAVGIYSLDPSDFASTVSFDNVSTISAVPGVEIEIPMGPRWSLKPLAYVGWGTRLDGDASAWIYWAGLKSQLRFGDEDFSWAMINSFTYVGQSSSDQEDGNASPLLTGFEFERPLGDKKIRELPVRLHWHFSYINYRQESKLASAITDLSTLELDDEWELGAAFSTGNEPLSLWRLKWDRVGVAYRLSGDGDFRGIALFFSSLFDR
jgi:hypothetical protein